MLNHAFSKHHHFFLSHIQITDSAAIYITHAIRTFAISLVGIYLPIFIFRLPNKFEIYADPVLNGLSWVLLYFVLRSLFTVIFVFLFSNIILTKIHLKKSLFYSSFILATELVMWLLIDLNIEHDMWWSWILLLTGVVSGLKVVTYWMPHHIFFVRKTSQGKKGNHFGKQTGIKVVIAKLTQAAGPLIGGILIASFGFSVTFGLGVILILISAIPVLFGVIEHTNHKHEVTKVLKKYVFNPKYAKISLALSGRGIDDAIYATFWPILLFVAIDDFVKVGSITTISLLISLITTVWVSRYIDKKGGQKVHLVGVIFNTLLYIPRMLTLSPTIFYGVDILDRLNSSLFGIPFLSKTYEKAKQLGDIDFIMYRELTLHSAIAVACTFAIAILPVVPDWKYMFVLAMLGSLLTYMIHSKVRTKRKTS